MNQGKIRKERFPFFPLIIIVIILVLGLVVMLLWNNILTPVLHVTALTFWQAVGLLILCRILFGGFARGGWFQGNQFRRGGPGWRQKWMNMTEEERAKFRDEWSKRCR